MKTPGREEPDADCVSRRKVALLTSNPTLLEPLLGVHAQGLEERGITIPIVLWIHPSMRLQDRVRDLYRVICRRARINRTTPVAQIVHHFAYRWIARGETARRTAMAGEALYGGHRTVLKAESGNDPGVLEVLRRSACSVCVIVGSDILTRQTLDTAGLPFVNVHMSDPAFMRGQPAVVWEILDNRESIVLTLHDVTSQLDAGSVRLQRECPIVWGPTLGATLAATRQRAAHEIAHLLVAGIAQYFDGNSTPRTAAAGPLRTTPTMGLALDADRICRQRFRAAQLPS